MKLRAALLPCMLIASSYALPSAIHATSAGCLLYFPSGAVACYPPNSVARAEVSLLRAPLSPIAVVLGVARLPLAQVITLGPRPDHINSILYIFELQPRYLGDIPRAQEPGEPGFVVVEEFIDVSFPPRPTFGRWCLLPRARACYNWQFRAELLRRHLGLLVTSNLRRQEVRRIGAAVMSESAGGE